MDMYAFRHEQYFGSGMNARWWAWLHYGLGHGCFGERRLREMTSFWAALGLGEVARWAQGKPFKAELRSGSRAAGSPNRNISFRNTQA